jgi:hypothetical protein
MVKDTTKKSQKGEQVNRQIQLLLEKKEKCRGFCTLHARGHDPNDDVPPRSGAYVPLILGISYALDAM